MEYIIFGVCIIGYLALATIMSFIQKKNYRAYFLRRLKAQYGSSPTKEYTLEQYERIAHYHNYCKAHKQIYEIDEITWNDLELEQVFQAMNYTHSSVGEEYLYHLLRTPLRDKEKLVERNTRILQFMDQESLRIQLQILFKELGSTGKFSIVDYMGLLDQVAHKKNTIHYIMLLFFVVCLVILPFSNLLGIGGLLFFVCFQMATYMKEKKVIEPYLTSISYLSRLVVCNEKINKVKAPELKYYQEKQQDALKVLSKFNRYLYSLLKNSAITSGNPLEILEDYLRMIFHYDLILLNGKVKMVLNYKNSFLSLLEIAGELEAEIAIAYFRGWLPEYCIPEFSNAVKLVHEDSYFPLMDQPVTNSISTKKHILLTGSNASGKSTFLRTIGVNSVLAQTIVTCAATKVVMPIMAVYSSMGIRDSLENKESYYLAEIKSIKRIIGATKEQDIPILCFIDEVLRGTNTIERIAASSQILASFSTDQIICFAATHDIELTTLLNHTYELYHFQEEVVGDDILFDYLLYKGPATSRNAIRLLQIMGYDEELIQKAFSMTENFLKNGFWSNGERT